MYFHHKFLEFVKFLPNGSLVFRSEACPWLVRPAKEGGSRWNCLVENFHKYRFYMYKSSKHARVTLYSLFIADWPSVIFLTLDYFCIVSKVSAGGRSAKTIHLTMYNHAWLKLNTRTLLILRIRLKALSWHANAPNPPSITFKLVAMQMVGKKINLQCIIRRLPFKWAYLCSKSHAQITCRMVQNPDHSHFQVIITSMATELHQVPRHARLKWFPTHIRIFLSRSSLTVGLRLSLRSKVTLRSSNCWSRTCLSACDEKMGQSWLAKALTHYVTACM